MVQKLPDSLMAWMDYYLEVAVQGVRSEEVRGKIHLHLQRFQQFFEQRYGQERISSCVKRDVLAWQQSLEAQGLAPTTINNHLASLSAFATWVHTQNKYVFSMGDPTKGIGDLSRAPLELRSLSEAQVQSLKICVTDCSPSTAPKAAAGRSPGKRLRSVRTPALGVTAPSCLSCCQPVCAVKNSSS